MTSVLSHPTTRHKRSVLPQETTEAEMERLLDALRQVVTEVGRVLLGQEDVIKQSVIALISGGHVLLEGPPGVGKTLLVRTLAEATGLSFARIQFTPDLMPADITGSMVLVLDENGRNSLQFKRGPVFTQLLLADEINRATPRTQSALLEAMQEQTVSSADGSMDLPSPFFVLATQNPIEMEGTHSLPEAQIDRFLFRVDVPYPSEAVLSTILQETTGTSPATVRQILTVSDIELLQYLVRDVPIAEHLRQSIARFSLKTQPNSPVATRDVNRFVRFGLSPRGAQSLVLAAKAHALFAGRYNVGFDDIRAILAPTVRHRIELNFEGRAEGIDMGRMLLDLFESSIVK